jgi:acyl dehydratase
MQVSSRFVGLQFETHRRDVNWRDAMNYAAAVQDPNPRYFDDERPQGILVHPMFCAAVTWPILAQVGEYLGAGKFPIHLLARQVHYTEHLKFHRPLKPTDSLTVEGKIAAILPHRSGTYIIARLDALDGEHAPVFTEHIGVLLRGVKCSDEGRGAESLPPAPTHPGNGPPTWEATIPIDFLRPFIYDGCTGITFPIHTSQAFARQVGLPGIILQGTATLAFAVRELVNREAGGDPLMLQALYCRFTDMVLPETEIRVQLVGKKLQENDTELYFVVLNHDGRKAISRGFALLRDPGAMTTTRK